MQIHNLSPEAILVLSEAAATADNLGKRLRISIDGDTIKFKVGEGMWTPPYTADPDPYYDGASHAPQQ